MEVLEVLAECLKRERSQARFYRALAAQAELGGREEEAERLNALHADEQHHLSRLAARILELGGHPGEAPSPDGGSVELDGWEEAAGSRESGEVAWYRQVLEAELDPRTRELIKGILTSEETHARELGGKWMPA